MQYLPIQDKIIDFFENLRAFESNFIYLGEAPQNPLPIMIMQEKEEMQSENKEKNNIAQQKEIVTIDNSVSENWIDSNSIEELHKNINMCLKCPFGKTRTNFVFGVGNNNADIMVIGEGPGADEDLQGEPFVGRAGQLLNKILEAIHLKREDVYIANVVKCRPPGNKTPTESEFKDCLPYLLKQIEIIKPKFILTLGAVPLLALFGKMYQISKHRGHVLDFKGIKVIPTYHPAYLLRNPSAKKLVWEDVQILEKLYNETK